MGGDDGGHPIGSERGVRTAEGLLERGEVEIPDFELSTGFTMEERNVPIEPAWDTGPFGPEPEVDVARSPGSFGMTAVDVETDVSEFKRLQKHIGVDMSSFDVDRREFFNRQVDWEKVDAMASELQRGEGEIPIPWVEVGLEGDLVETQEGRHRVLAAERAGLERIPFRILVNTKSRRNDPPPDGRDVAESIENDLNTGF